MRSGTRLPLQGLGMFGVAVDLFSIKFLGSEKMDVWTSWGFPSSITGSAGGSSGSGGGGGGRPTASSPAASSAADHGYYNRGGSFDGLRDGKSLAGGPGAASAGSSASAQFAASIDNPARYSPHYPASNNDMPPRSPLPHVNVAAVGAAGHSGSQTASGGVASGIAPLVGSAVFNLPSLLVGGVGASSAPPVVATPSASPAAPPRAAILRVRVATGAVSEDATVARLLAEAHARLYRFQEEREDGEVSQKSVFTAARSGLGDIIDVSDLVGNVLRSGEVLVGLTEEESSYAPQELHPIFGLISDRAAADPNNPSKLKSRDQNPFQISFSLHSHASYRRPSGTPPRRLSLAPSPPTQRKPAQLAPGLPAASLSSASRTSVVECLVRVPCPSPPWSSTAGSRPAPMVLAWVPCVVEVVGEGEDSGFMQVRHLWGGAYAEASVGKPSSSSGAGSTYSVGGRTEVVGIERLRVIVPPSNPLKSSTSSPGSHLDQSDAHNPGGEVPDGEEIEVFVQAGGSSSGWSSPEGPARSPTAGYKYAWYIAICTGAVDLPVLSPISASQPDTNDGSSNEEDNQMNVSDHEEAATNIKVERAIISRLMVVGGGSSVSDASEIELRSPSWAVRMQGDKGFTERTDEFGAVVNSLIDDEFFEEGLEDGEDSSAETDVISDATFTAARALIK
ncbi:hypothetical protein DFJ73DRAFT_893650 [Zopfochytrium polystomum]|nr:hypothetical protein DFJ73DRAFT_893650 [Zopfochytrium polystomum]